MGVKLINIIVNCLNSPTFRTLSIILGLIGGLLLSNLHVTRKYIKRIEKQPQNKDYLEKELEKEKKQIIIYWIAIIFILIAPIAINFFFSLNVQYPTAPHLGNTDWLGFWGSYTGGVIGAIVTGIAFFFTYTQNQKQHEETRKQMEAQNRLKILPILSLNLTGTKATGYNLYHQCLDLLRILPTNISDFSKGYIFMTYQVKNISQYPALFFTLNGGDNGCVVNHLLPQEETTIHLGSPHSGKDYEGNFNLCFFDMEGNYYQQQVHFFYISKIGIFGLRQPEFPQLFPNPSYKTNPSTRQLSEEDQ